MYSPEDRKRAVELYIEYDLSATDTVRELGYPTRQALYLWYKEYKKNGGLHNGPREACNKYSKEQKIAAVDHYLEHGRSISRTRKSMGYPSRLTLRSWIDELAPGERQVLTGMAKQGKAPALIEEKKAAVIDLCSRKGPAKEVAAKYGTSRGTLYQWKKKLLAKERMPVRPDYDKPLPDDIETLLEQNDELKDKIKDLEHQRYRLQMEVDILTATAEVLKKGQGIDPVRLSNKEKTIVIDALRTIYPLNELLERMGLAKSSYFYQKDALAAPDKYADLRSDVRLEFELSNSAYGYRRIRAKVTRNGEVVSEKVIRNIMAEEELKVIAKTTRKYNSYKGEISPEVENIVGRDFHAARSNELWLTDITEFSIPAGKVYLSPIIDCFDGMVPAWSIGMRPNAELVNTMLDAAVSTLDEGEHPTVHSDRGCHYRWPGWIERMDAAGLTRSMSKKGCSPDNAACEGFFGRLKNEFFYGRSWKGVSIPEFIVRLDDYMHWYNETRIKESLGYLSPLEYRQSLNLGALVPMGCIQELELAA